MQEHASEFSVRSMSRVLEVSHSGYYLWLKTQKSPGTRAVRNERLLDRIRLVHKKSRQIYGSDKICKEIRKTEIVNHKCVERLMQENGIKSKRNKGRRYIPKTTDSNHDLPIPENLLNREFNATAPNQKWVGDISYIRTEEGWLYLAVFIDLYSRLVVGWATSANIKTELIERAFLMGQKRRGRAVGPMVHSDRGSQYASDDFTDKLKAWKCLQSMSRKGNCWDNAVAESFFSLLKEEMVHHEQFKTRKEATDKIFDYIEVFYNRQRIHSSAGNLSPVEFEAMFETQQAA